MNAKQSKMPISKYHRQDPKKQLELLKKTHKIPENEMEGIKGLHKTALASIPTGIELVKQYFILRGISKEQLQELLSDLDTLDQIGPRILDVHYKQAANAFTLFNIPVDKERLMYSTYYNQACCKLLDCKSEELQSLCQKIYNSFFSMRYLIYAMYPLAPKINENEINNMHNPEAVQIDEKCQKELNELWIKREDLLKKLRGGILGEMLDSVLQCNDEQVNAYKDQIRAFRDRFFESRAEVAGEVIIRSIIIETMIKTCSQAAKDRLLELNS